MSIAIIGWTNVAHADLIDPLCSLVIAAGLSSVALNVRTFQRSSITNCDVAFLHRDIYFFQTSRYSHYIDENGLHRSYRFTYLTSDCDNLIVQRCNSNRTFCTGILSLPYFLSIRLEMYIRHRLPHSSVRNQKCTNMLVFHSPDREPPEDIHIFDTHSTFEKCFPRQTISDGIFQNGVERPKQ